MKKEIADRWVAALRSGLYQQTQGHLRDGDGFCCLGVLCDLFREERGGEWQLASSIGDRYAFLGDAGILPAGVRSWAGMETRDGRYTIEPDPYLGTRDSLSAANDRGKSFDEIATLIELHAYEL